LQSTRILQQLERGFSTTALTIIAKRNRSGF
jgi:hypothetical protein